MKNILQFYYCYYMTSEPLKSLLENLWTVCGDFTGSVGASVSKKMEKNWDFEINPQQMNGNLHGVYCRYSELWKPLQPTICLNVISKPYQIAAANQNPSLTFARFLVWLYKYLPSSEKKPRCTPQWNLLPAGNRLQMTEDEKYLGRFGWVQVFPCNVKGSGGFRPSCCMLELIKFV